MGRVLKRLVVAVAVAGAGALGGCGPSGAQLPPIPMEVVAVQAEYENPTGTVPPSAIDQITELESKLATIESTRIADVVRRLLDSVRQRLVANGLATDPAARPNKPQRPVIIGSVTVTRTCRGWDDTSTTPDPANGSIELTAEYQSSILQAVVWGTATSCHERIDVTNNVTVHPFFDGSVAVYLEGPIQTDPTQSSFLVGWNGTIGTEMTGQASASFDFRVVPPNVEVRLSVPDGHIIGSVGANGVQLRGTNGTFGCSLQTFTCSIPQVPIVPPPAM